MNWLLELQVHCIYYEVTCRDPLEASKRHIRFGLVKNWKRLSKAFNLYSEMWGGHVQHQKTF